MPFFGRKTAWRLAVAAAGSALLVTAAACSSSPSSSTGSTSDQVGSSAKADLSDPTSLGGAAAASAMGKLYQQAIAKGETTVTVYGPVDGQLQSLGSYAQFEKRFPGIKINTVLAFGSSLAQKLQAESTSGKHVADVVHSGTDVIGYASSGQLQPFKPVTASSLPSNLAGPDGDYYVNMYGALGIMINTSKLSAAQAPKNWNDLADAQYKGQVAMTDPGTPGQLSDSLAALTYSKKLSWSTLTSIAHNSPQIVSSPQLAMQAVETGQAEITPGVGVGDYLTVKKQGAPVQLIFPLDGPTFMAPTYLGILKGAPDLDAAELLETWSFSPEGQAGLAKAGMYGTVPGSPAPNGMPTLNKIQLVSEPSPASAIGPNFNSVVAKLKSLFH